MTDNIFERVAQNLKKTEQQTFADNMLSAKYFEISNATKKIGRHFPQTERISLYNAHAIPFHEFPSINIEFKEVHIHDTSKLTDCISDAAISAHGFILSDKALEVFRKYDLGTYKVYPMNLYHKNIKYDYGFLHILNDMVDLIDFERSTFFVEKLIGGHAFDIKVKGKADFIEKRKLAGNGTLEGTEKYWDVSFRSAVFKNVKTPDFFTLTGCGVTKFITKNLKEEISKNKLTGFEIMPTPIIVQ
jgi:hypothetical protein